MSDKEKKMKDDKKDEKVVNNLFEMFEGATPEELNTAQEILDSKKEHIIASVTENQNQNSNNTKQSG